MSFASSAVTYTSVYTDSEPRWVFWGADEEISNGGSSRVIVYRYDRLPMQPVAPPSPDYIPDLEDLQTPPYIPLEDEHVFLVEEQPLPPVDSPTAESPRYIAESDPEEDPEEDDADDEDGDKGDEDNEDDEEEEHLAPTDSAVVVPTVELVSSPEGTKPVIPPPVGYGIRDTWVDPAEAVPEVAPMTVGDQILDYRACYLHELTYRHVCLTRGCSGVGLEYHERVCHGLTAGRLNFMGIDDSQETNMDMEEEAYAFPRGLGSLDRIELDSSS
ncbi:hypothetical protein Tco_0653674 [Tanacetum coccineum]|uniref:Uncharacterized protein n=1 Tax=Tanacetum coccineum TaxID=301880 RepID=A0ABQ4X185_9ASTR